MNTSVKNEDSRSIQRIVFEKANFGAVPTFFRIEGDSRLHPVIWSTHPHLAEVMFSDGSSSQVVATYDPDLEKQVLSRSNDKPKDRHIEITEEALGYGSAARLDGFDVDVDLSDLRDTLADSVKAETQQSSIAGEENTPSFPFDGIFSRTTDFKRTFTAEELADAMTATATPTTEATS